MVNGLSVYVVGPHTRLRASSLRSVYIGPACMALGNRIEWRGGKNVGKLRQKIVCVLYDDPPREIIHLNIHDRVYLYSRHTRVVRLCPHRLQSTLFLGANYSDRFQAD